MQTLNDPCKLILFKLIIRIIQILFYQKRYRIVCKNCFFLFFRSTNWFILKIKVMMYNGAFLLTAYVTSARCVKLLVHIN